MKHFNKLTPAEAERLALLSEECAEVIQIICKINRHGYESYHPNKPETSNRSLLEKEIGHIQSAYELMTKSGDIETSETHNHAFIKTQKVGKWLHHQPIYSAE